MACRCKEIWAPNNPSDVLARVLIGIAYITVQLLFIFLILRPLYGKSKSSTISFIVLLSMWGVFSLLWIWAYIRTCWLDAGSLEHELIKLGYLVDGKLQNLPPELQNLQRCRRCCLPKPDRTHHCQKCDMCYFRFDHHCPWIGNCVALYNLKAFMLFNIYNCILLFIATSGCICSILFASIVPMVVLILFAIAAFMMGGFLGCFGCSYFPAVCINQTTLERIAGVPSGRFDDGEKKNFEQIFGNCFLSWILPTKPPVTGFMWSGIADPSELDHPSNQENGNIDNVSENEDDEEDFNLSVKEE